MGGSAIAAARTVVAMAATAQKAENDRFISVREPMPLAAFDHTSNRFPAVKATNDTVRAPSSPSVRNDQPSIASTTASKAAPCSRPCHTKAQPTSGSSVRRGGRCMMRGSSGTPSKAREQMGSMTISVSATWTGSMSGGQPNATGSSARPAIGTWIAVM
jgi:hypothetical protein